MMIRLLVIPSAILAISFMKKQICDLKRFIEGDHLMGVRGLPCMHSYIMLELLKCHVIDRVLFALHTRYLVFVFL